MGVHLPFEEGEAAGISNLGGIGSRGENKRYGF